MLKSRVSLFEHFYILYDAYLVFNQLNEVVDVCERSVIYVLFLHFI